MYRIRFQQSSAYGWRHRLRAALHRLRGGGLGKSQRLYFVTLNGHRYKRLIMPDSAAAAEVEDRLERLGFLTAFPRPITRFENELWLEFIRGRSEAAASAARVESLAAFYGTLYRVSPTQHRVAQTRAPLRLRRDLDFLLQAGVVNADAHAQLHAAADRLEPETLWTGFDYVDPVLKNLVERDDGGGLCAVDVESLVEDVPLGTGVAKAMLHWLSPWADSFWGHLEAQGVPPIRDAFPYVDLCLTARWTKTKVLTGKHHAVDGGRFERFLRRTGEDDAPAAAKGYGGSVR